MKTGFFSEKIEKSILEMSPEQRQLASWIMQGGKLYNFAGASFIKVELDDAYPRFLMNNDDLTLCPGRQSVVPVFAEREKDSALFFLSDPTVEAILHDFWQEPLWAHYLEAGECELVGESYGIIAFNEQDMNFIEIQKNPAYARYFDFSSRVTGRSERGVKVYLNFIIDQLLADLLKSNARES